jgi:hypothetical protein
MGRKMAPLFSLLVVILPHKEPLHYSRYALATAKKFSIFFHSDLLILSIFFIDNVALLLVS